MSDKIKFFGPIIAIVLIVASGAGWYEYAKANKEKEVLTEIHILDAKAGVDWMTNSAELLEVGKKPLISKAANVAALVGIINNHYGTDESKCAQKLVESSIDPFAVVIGNASLLVEYASQQQNNIYYLKKLSETDGSDVKALFQILSDHSAAIANGTNPKNDDNLVSVFECSDKLSVLFNRS